MNDIREELAQMRGERFNEKIDWIFDATVFGLVCVICWIGYLVIR